MASEWPALLSARACVLRPFASAADAWIVFETEVLRLRVRGLFELYDDIVAVALGQFGFADERVVFLLELQFCFAVLGFGDNRRSLRSRRHRHTSSIVKRDGNGFVLLDEELGLGRSLFKNASALRTRLNFLGIGCSQ